MLSQQYAEALYSISRNRREDEMERIVQNFVGLLKKKGHTKLLPAVLREYEKIEIRKNSEKELLLRVAKEADVEKYKDQIENDVAMLKGNTLVRKVIIDETLIGGYEVRAHGERIDRTHKRKLLNMYNNLITN